MKFNFGHGVTLFFIVFMATSIFQVFKSRQYDNALTKEDYYVDDLTLENNLTKKRNVNLLKGFSFMYNEANDTLYLTIPNSGNFKGTLEMVSPVHKSEDEIIQLNVVNNKVAIDLKKYRKGKWNCILDWQDTKASYLYDTSFILS
jgi:FixH